MAEKEKKFTHLLQLARKQLEKLRKDNQVLILFSLGLLTGDRCNVYMKEIIRLTEVNRHFDKTHF